MNSERRRSRRRSLPFVRSAVLSFGTEAHIMLLTDLGSEGAFLTTRMPEGVPHPPANEKVKLRMVVPRNSREVQVPCEVVWRSDRFDATSGRPSGMAVRFLEIDADTQRLIDEFAQEGFRPSAAPTPAEHYEHRIIERPTVDASELNRFGRDGWRLVTLMPTAHGFKLVLVRRI